MGTKGRGKGRARDTKGRLERERAFVTDLGEEIKKVLAKSAKAETVDMGNIIATPRVRVSTKGFDEAVRLFDQPRKTLRHRRPSRASCLGVGGGLIVASAKEVVDQS